MKQWPPDWIAAVCVPPVYELRTPYAHLPHATTSAVCRARVEPNGEVVNVTIARFPAELPMQVDLVNDGYEWYAFAFHRGEMQQASAEEELHCAIQDALAGERSTVRTGRSLTSLRPSGKRPYVIHVLPSHRRNADEPLKQPMALVLIIDPEDEPEPAAALLRRLYRLTEAEAEIALHVMHGADVKQISEELSISLTTVRTHLQHVFDKTDTHRQAELVRLLLVLRP